MTHILASADSRVHAEAIWTLKKRNASGLFVPVFSKKNIITNYGLSALASAIGGGYAPPQYLVIDNFYTTLSSTASIGNSTIHTVAQWDTPGDTILYLEPGTANQEIRTYAGGMTGSGPYNYPLTAPVSILHNSGSKVVRSPMIADTLADVQSEQQFDAANSPGLRAQAAAGYSTGVGNWTMQFYFTSTQANFFLMTLALSENPNVGAGNIHNHIIFAYDNTAGASDLEIDVSLTLT